MEQLKFDWTRSKIKNMTNKEFLQFTKDVIEEHQREPKTFPVMIRFPYDLRTGLDEKIADTYSESRWTAFVNNTGTLCHAVCAEADILIRIKFTYPIDHLSESRMNTLITARLRPWLKF